MSIQLGHRPRTAAPLLIAATLFLCGPGHAQTDDVAPLFASNDVIELTLSAPMRTLVNRRLRRPEVDGTISFTDSSGATTELAVEVTTRGHNRLEICSFPPLSLNLRRREVGGTLFAGQNRLKLVTPCRNNEDYEQYLELEYLTYRIFEKITDLSFKVRPVRMRYVDTDRDNREQEAPAFLIEHKNGVAARVGLEAVDVPRIRLAELDTAQIAAVSIFQYMIGNTDWSALEPADDEDCCHNSAVLANTDNSERYWIVPYDFDNAGLVNTSYSRPNDRLSIRRVTDRLYRGYCIASSGIDGVIEKFNASRPAIEALFSSSALSDETREPALEFLADGYRILNDPAETQSKIVDGCRG